MSTDALSRLVSKIPPPIHPTGLTRSWRDVEAELKMSLPQDYKDFISAYGSGRFDPYELCVFNLLFEVGTLDDADFIRGQVEFAYDADAYPASKNYLDVSTVFPFGSDGFSNDYFWHQAGPPDDWYVVVVECGTKYHRFPKYSTTEFLAAMFLREDPEVTALSSIKDSDPACTFFAAPPQ